MKQTLLIILFLAHTVKPILPFVEYGFNYNYIATVLCINKDKPKMQCNGKCHLAKMVANNATPSEEKSIPTARLDLLFIPMFCQKLANISFSNPLENMSTPTTLFRESNYTFRMSGSLFKPPILAFVS